MATATAAAITLGSGSENVTLKSVTPDVGAPQAATFKGSYLRLPAVYTATVDPTQATKGVGIPTLITSGASYSVALRMSQAEMDKLAVATPCKFRIDWTTSTSPSLIGLLLTVGFKKL